jgi:hypothetical protein
MVFNSWDLHIFMDHIYIYFRFSEVVALLIILLQGGITTTSLLWFHSSQASSATYFIGMMVVLELGKVVMLDGSATTLLGVGYFFSMKRFPNYYFSSCSKVINVWKFIWLISFSGLLPQHHH